MALPTHVRLIALALGLLAALALVGTGAGDLLTDPIAASGLLLVGLPFVALFAWAAAWPEHADRTLKERYGLDLADAGTLAAVIVHLVFVFLVFGLTLIGAAESLSTLVAEGRHPASDVSLSGPGIVATLVLNLVFFLVAALTWIVLADKLRGREILASLRMTVEGLPRGIVGGILGAIAGILIAVLLGFGLQQLGFTPQNPQAQAIADALTWETALAVAALAALGEEIYFRGFLLPRTSNLTQSVLFGIVHASYLTPLQIVLPFLLGLGFGWLTRATNLWGAVVAHFGFNAVMLFSAIHGDELAAALPVLGLL